MRTRQRFRGAIAGAGSSSGTRVVVGHWVDSPLGTFSDAMVERPDGRRVLLAPTPDVAAFVAATYSFDEIRIEPFTVAVDPDDRSWRVRSTSLTLDLAVGRVTGLGVLLALVPRPVARAPWWCAVTDVVARVVLRGVRTRGDTGERREWYGATGNRAVTAISGSLDGESLGELARVDPPPRFGFSSTPASPSVTQVVTTVELGAE